MKKPKAAAVTVEKPVNLKKYYYILGILIFFVFANTIGNGYNLDDELVTRNHKLTSRGLEAVSDIFTSPYYSDNMGYAYGYRPIVHLSFALEHAIFGEKPNVSHFFNVLLYVFSVVLFFKLLLKWAGEKNILFALLAVILFAIHPVHTEVVASIKNRDEILAFLFVILSGLSLERYLVKGKILNLLWVFLFFTVAMLSKKSVFPMAILLPLIAVFTKEINFRQLLLITALLLVPASLVGSEMNLPKMLLMFGIGALLVFSVFYLRKARVPAVDWKKTAIDYRPWTALSLAAISFAAWQHSLVLYLLAALMLIPLQFKSLRWFTLVFLAEGTGAFYLFGFIEILHLALMVPVFFAARNLFARQNDWLTWMFILAGLIGFSCLDLTWGILVSVVISFLLAFSVQKKWFVSAAIAVVVLVLSIFIYKLSFVLLFIVLVAALKSMETLVKKIDLMQLVPVISLLFVLGFNYPAIQPDRIQPERQDKAVIVTNGPRAIAKTVVDQSILKEGRSLEMIENTLILPHTKRETIATGAATLGEYMRLMLFPYELSFYYGYARTKTVSFNNPWVWVSIVIYLGLIVLAFLQWKKRPWISIGIGWYVACILLFSNWIELVAGMVGERLAFTASAGFCIFLAALILWIRPGFSIQKPRAVELLTGLLLVCFLFKTIGRNSTWKDPLTLMGNDIQHLQNSAQANNLYALYLMRSSMEDPGQTAPEITAKQQLAIQHFDQALRVWPDFFNAAFDKGRAGVTLKDTSAAIAGYERAVSIGNANFLDPYYQLGDLYIQTGRKKDFLSLTHKIFDLSKDKAEGYSVLARGYFVNDYIDSSRYILQRGLQKFPDDNNLKMNLQMIPDEKRKP